MKLARIALLGLLLILTACGDGDPAGPGNGGNGNGNGTNLPNGTFSATVNGAAFNAAMATAAYSETLFALGAANTQGRGLGFALFAAGPGTYTIGSSIGANATYTDASGGGSGWGASAAVAGSSGSVTFSTLNSTRAAGTFTFTLVPMSGGASGTRTVSGSFDLTIAN